MLPLHTNPAPVIRTLLELDALVENIVELQRARTDLKRAQEQEINAIRQKYQTPLIEVESYLAMETAWAENWARLNPAKLSGHRLLECTHATIGFHSPEPSVERASRKWTWSAAAQRLSEVAWGARYLRTPAAEVNKEAILTDRKRFSADELREFGLKIVEQDRFSITPHQNSLTEDEGGHWQEAA